MFSPRFAAALLSIACVVTASAANVRSKPTRPESDGSAYKGAIVIDAATGNVLFEDRADVVSPPASMTKLMTYAIVEEALRSGQLRLDQPVKIERADAAIGGTQVYLDPRESFSVEELIYAMMIQSANDAAHALARVTAGSVAAFVERMNARAAEIGMTRTTFRSPHGLPPSSRRVEDGDLTTPRDFAILSRHLLQRTDVLKYTSVRERDFGLQRTQGPIKMINHNKLLVRVPGVDGLKTGYTQSAGYCLASTAQRDGRRVIAVIMGSFGPGGQRDLGKTRDIKAIELLERGFAALPATSGAAMSAPAGVHRAPARPGVPTASGGVPSPISPAPISAAPVAAPSAAESSEQPVVRFSLPRN